jgi:phospholipase C
MLHPVKRPTGKRLAAAGGTAAAAALALTSGFLGLGAGPATAGENHPSGTTTPIQHVVVIFQENVSFDHYFATYPQAANTPGETLQGTATPAPAFTAAANTPKGINTLANAGLLAPNNPNSSSPPACPPCRQ